MKTYADLHLTKMRGKPIKEKHQVRAIRRNNNKTGFNA